MQEFPAAQLDGEMLMSLHDMERRLSEASGQPIVLVAYAQATDLSNGWNKSQVAGAHVNRADRQTK
ncbi:MAG: hypothetical protein OWT28_03850 [Firmicutes bacterium]|nr:hypothetical protein [Bacillota bacterium]